MKTMTATALLAAGKVTPTTPVPCPGTTTVDGRQFQNENKFDLGTVPLTTAFAQSCNTTFIQQAMTLPDDALAAAAHSYGVGADLEAAGRHLQRQPCRPTRTGHDEGRRRDRPGAGADEPGRAGAGGRRDRQRQAGAAGGGRRRAAPSGQAPPAAAGRGPRRAAADDAPGGAGRHRPRGLGPGRGVREDRDGRVRQQDPARLARLVHGLPAHRCAAARLAFATLVEAGQSSGIAVRITDAFLGALR